MGKYALFELPSILLSSTKNLVVIGTPERGINQSYSVIYIYTGICTNMYVRVCRSSPDICHGKIKTWNRTRKVVCEWWMFHDVPSSSSWSVWRQTMELCAFSASIIGSKNGSKNYETCVNFRNNNNGQYC